MGKALILTAARKLAFEESAREPLKPDQVRVRTLFSGISAGTELTHYRGTNPYMNKRWDAERRLFLPGQTVSKDYPIRDLGYEEVGEVVEAGTSVTDVAIGTHVFGTWNHRTEAVIPASYARERRMPEGADPIFGIFSHIGAVALNGVHDGRIRLGETVAVFGLGGLGQIVAQAVRRSGGRVLGVDLHENRRAMARQLGTSITLDAHSKTVAEEIKDLTGGRGADVCIEVSGSTAALNTAIRAAAYSARVVAMGFFQGEANAMWLGEEFHHNRINVVCSQISGPDPELTYRWDKLRLWQTAVRLQAEGILDLRPLITHTAPFEKAAELYEVLDRDPQQVVQAVMTF